jgi:hypothetical protein
MDFVCDVLFDAAASALVVDQTWIVRTIRPMTDLLFDDGCGLDEYTRVEIARPQSIGPNQFTRLISNRLRSF